jgi:hypothetical protein
MSVSTSNEARQRVVRWLEEGHGQLSAAQPLTRAQHRRRYPMDERMLRELTRDAVLGILHDYDRVQSAAQMAEQECERLRAFVYENERLRNQIEGLESECGKLREEIQNLRGLGERYLREREDIAASLSQLMNDVLLRLRGEPHL